MGASGQDTQFAASALDAIPEAYIVLDEQFRFVYMNRTARAIRCRNKPDLVGRCIWDTDARILDTIGERELRRVAAERKSSAFEYFDPACARWFHVGLHPLPQGGICGVFRDITAERRTRETLEREQDVLVALAQGQLFGTFRWRVPEDRVEASSGVFELFNLPAGPSETSAGFWYRQFPPADALAGEATVARVFAEKRDCFGCDIQAPAGAGDRRRWLHVLARVTYDLHGKALALTGIVFDASERKRLEADAEESRERLRLTLESASVGVWTANPITGAFTASETARTILGLAPDAPFDESIAWSLVHPDHREDLQSRLREAFQTGRTLAAEARIVRPSGDVRWVQGRGRIAVNRVSGEPEIVGILQDITERKLAELQMQALFDNMPGAVCIFDRSLRLLTVNREYARLAGATLEAACDTAVDERFEFESPDGVPLPRDQWPMERARRGETVVNQEIRLKRRHDGEINWVLANALTLHSPEFRVIVNLRDINARKRAQRALEQSETRFSAITSTVPEILFSATPEGVTDYQNERFRAYTGIHSDALLEDGWLEVTHPEDRDRVRAAWAESVSSGEVYEINYRLRRHDAVYRWFQCRAVPIRDEHGAIVRWFGVCTDIDDHIRLEEELAERSAELQRSNEDLQRFAYAASHDLQEPLRMIGSFTQLLTRKNQDAFDEQSKQFARVILNGVDRMRHLIHDLLEYSRVSHAAEPDLAPVDMNAVLGQALQNLQFKISECEARVTFDPLPSVCGNATRLVQVLQNLIGNAITYCEVQPAVQISVRSDCDDWVFSVKDNGIGIAAEYCDRVFQLFERLHSSDEYPGTGLGLAIVRRIVEQHGGRIWLSSTPGAGSTFHFTLRAV